MAYRGPAYGLTLACLQKTREKFDLEKSKDAIRWIEEVTGLTLRLEKGEVKDEFHVASVLKDGVGLCELMNRIQPGSIRKIHKSKAPFQQMENLNMFTTACRKYGMNTLDIFQTTDLYEVKAMYTAQEKGYTGPVLGVKLAQKNERNFTEEQIAESNRVIGLQYGSNQVASQAGMTPYGLHRQIMSPGGPTPTSPTSDGDGSFSPTSPILNNGPFRLSTPPKKEKFPKFSETQNTSGL